MDQTIEKISFHYIYPPFSFKNRKALKKFLLILFKKEAKDIETISYIFCSDEYLLQINQQYLKHDTLTDIITFELSPKSQPTVSDIYISIDRVKENARIFKTSFANELHRVIFHGALHLVGYKDKTEMQRTEMRKKEDEYLRKYFVSRETYGEIKD